MKKLDPSRLVALTSKYLAFLYKQKELSRRTKENHFFRVNMILDYLAETGQINIHIKEVDVKFIEGYMAWSNERVQLTYTSRNVELIKKVIDYAISLNIISHNPISLVITSRSPVKEVVSLSEQELDLIYNYSSANPNKQLAAELYFLQADTGMSYGDLWSFEVTKEETGYWLYNKRVKGRETKKREYWVPLSERSLSLINKHNGRLPLLRNYLYNRHIKNVCRDLNIMKYLTTHTARKTFATRMYDRGWSLESIADMMGITVSVLTIHYIKKSRRRIEFELKARAAQLS